MSPLASSVGGMLLESEVPSGLGVFVDTTMPPYELPFLAGTFGATNFELQ